MEASSKVVLFLKCKYAVCLINSRVYNYKFQGFFIFRKSIGNIYLKIYISNTIVSIHWDAVPKITETGRNGPQKCREIIVIFIT